MTFLTAVERPCYEDKWFIAHIQRETDRHEMSLKREREREKKIQSSTTDE